MVQSPFHAYYTARKLESLSDDDRFILVFASSDIKDYPFQIAIPNADLLSQWVELIERHYTVPFVVKLEPIE